METVLTNARVVTADTVMTGTVVIADDAIAQVAPGSSGVAGAEDLDGDILVAGLVDLHTDALEKHFMPRPNVPWDAVSAAIAHDAQTTTAGITTVFEALGVGGSVAHPERNETLAPMIAGIHHARNNDMLRGDHLLHLRCEVTNESVMELFHQFVDHPLVRFMSVMDHAPGHRQYSDLAHYRAKHKKNHGLNDEEVDAFVNRLMDQSSRYGPSRRAELIEIGHAKGLPVASHDDRTREDVELAAKQGLVMAEFPIFHEAAALAQELGLMVLAGGPNLVRGSSQHPDNVSTGDLAKRRQVDVLASDYIPVSMLQAAFRLTEPKFGYALPEAMNTISKTPAETAGLHDRGEIAVGKRADLVQVRKVGDLPLVRKVWSRGVRVA